MSHYKSNLRDLQFNLFEFLDIGASSLGRAPFGGLDEPSVREALRVFERVCTSDIAASFEEADRLGLGRDDTGMALLPESLKRGLAAYYAGDWHRLELPEHMGGLGAPPTVVWALFELLIGSNPPAAFYVFGNVIARVIDRLGTDAQKQRFIAPMIDQRWGASMVLTEPDAGSDVGAARAKARHVEGDLWEIEGAKRFITNGDFDGVTNIIHLVLARPEGAGGGTKGLSLFIVPKWLVNDDGSVGARNGVRCTHVEKKMGIKASATCELTFGDGAPARGWLMGDRHDGIRQMFHVIEQARMAIGMKSMSTLSTAYLNALAYTKERIQGADLTKARDKSAPRVAIIQHADVRRMLLLQKSHAEGMRALCLFVASLQDQIELAGGHGSAASTTLDGENDLLLPLVKGFCSERAYELLAVSLQCFGGSGYMQDYPIEQYIRDQKIDTLYEGTTHIQALDLLLRKIGRDGGATLRRILDRVRATVDGEEGGAALANERRALARGLADVEAIFQALLGKLGESLHHAGLQGNRILMALAELVIGWLLVRHAALASLRGASASGPERAFYDGKVASAKFYCAEVLPSLALTRTLVEQGTLETMAVAEEAF